MTINKQTYIYKEKEWGFLSERNFIRCFESNNPWALIFVDINDKILWEIQSESNFSVHAK